MFKIIIRGRNCEKYLGKCIKSLVKQKEDWSGILILDNPKDKSFELAKKIIYDKGLPITIHLNPKRMGLGYNLWSGITHCGAKKEDVICILDADDYLHKKALRTVRKTYELTKCLVTYGSYVKLSKGKRTKISMPYKKKDNPRKTEWHGSHFKTFKYKLWNHFPEEYLQHNGKWAEAASDRALMYTLMEIAGMKNCRHIHKKIYFWRDNYKHSTNRGKQLKWDRIFRDKKPLQKIF